MHGFKHKRILSPLCKRETEGEKENCVSGDAAAVI